MKILSLIIIVFCLATAAGGGWVVFAKAMSIYDLRQSAADATARQHNIVALKELWQNTVNERQMINQAVITEDEVASFLQILESLAKETSVELEVAAAEIVNDQTPALNLEFEAKGKFGVLFRWLGLVESLPYSIVVESIDARTVGGAATSTAWMFNGSLKVLSVLIPNHANR